MDKYIILAYSIVDMGGGQIYYRNKLAACLKKNFQVYIFSAYKGKIYIEELKQFDCDIFPELKYSPYELSQRQRKRVIDSILSRIQYTKEDRIIIESSTISEAIWGEILAEKCGAVNIAFILGEGPIPKSKELCYFLDFKLSRNELYCIKPEVMKKMFIHRTLSDEDCRSLKAVCFNSVEDVDIPSAIQQFEIDSNSTVICIIGRLRKPYVLKAVEEIGIFSNRHKDTNITVLIIGGDEKRYENRLRKVLDKYERIKYYITGYIYPIPYKLLRQCDLCIAAAGSVRAAVCCRRPVISIDIYTNKALGVWGYNTISTLTAGEKDNEIDINQCIEKVLHTDFLINHEFNQKAADDLIESIIEPDFADFFEILHDMKHNEEYYKNFSCLSFKCIFEKILSIIGGVELIDFLKRLKHMIGI